MLHLAVKAFAPAKVPFPIMHVDTGHNFPEVIEFRDRRWPRPASAWSWPRCRTPSTPARSSRRPGRGRPATGSRPPPCSTASRSIASTPSSAAPAATRRRLGPRSASTASATSSASGIRRASAPNSGTSTTAAHAGRALSRSSPSRTGPSSTSGTTSGDEDRRPRRLLRPQPAGLPARRHVAGDTHSSTLDGDEVEERMCASAPSATPPAPVPSSRRRHHRQGHRRGRRHPDHRARRHPSRRPGHRSRHGRPQERGLLLDGISYDWHRGFRRRRKSTLIGRLLYDSKSIFEDQMEAIEATSLAGATNTSTLHC